MKNIFTLSLFFTGLLLHAQGWCPGGAAWYYSVNHNQTAGYQYWHNDGDTVVNGVACNVVRGTQYLTTTGVPDTAISQLGPVYTYTSSDTVYLFDTAFYPAFYFNAQPSDTIYTRNMGSTGLSLVDSTGKIVFNGDTLNYYTYHLLGSCTDSPMLEFKAIERIGCTGTSFVPGWNCADTAMYNYSLCNYSDSFFAAYPDSTTGCTYLGTPSVLPYHHLLDSVNIWHYAFNVCGEALPPTGNNGRAVCDDPTARGILYTSGNTIVNGHLYKLLYVNSNWPFFYLADSCLLGFIREDTLSGKIYYLASGNAAETLIYNFAMQPGDSFPINFPYPGYGTGYWESGSYKLISTDSINTIAGLRKQYHLICDTCQQSNPLTWIEGIGNIVDAIYPFSDNGGFACGPYGQLNGFQYHLPYFVTCFAHNQLVYFDTQAYNLALQGVSNGQGWTLMDSCDATYPVGGIQSITSLSSFTTYPNPTSSKVTLQLNVAETASFDIYVTDIEGKSASSYLQLGRLNEGLHTAEMDVANLSPGFYLVECRTGAGSLYSKLIVQK